MHTELEFTEHQTWTLSCEKRGVAVGLSGDSEKASRFPEESQECSRDGDVWLGG